MNFRLKQLFYNKFNPTWVSSKLQWRHKFKQ